MKAALCDDEPGMYEELGKLLEKYSFDRNRDITLDYYDKPETMLESEKYDLYFLDYIMPSMNGADAAAQLRTKYNNAVTICFLTTYEKAAVDVINRNINAEAFMMKPVDEQELYRVLDRFFSRSMFNRLILKCDNITRIVYPQDILYVEAARKSTVFHFFNATESFPYPFGEIENEHLPENIFCRVHRSYIVNLMHIESFKKNSVTMKNGEIIPMRNEKSFHEALSNFNISLIR
ncbi:MAG: LytTR family DNA-binding domain-containing protein [Clostridia bacterium]|nr:LytTR family DNA-binding domain-containing protein [Clostridia bacterium]